MTQFEQERGMFEIDANQLDIEWMQQPKLVYDCAMSVAESRNQYEQAKSELELVRSELDSAIRSDPEKFGLSKTTEAVVSNTIILQPEYQQAQQKMIKLRKRYDEFQAVLTALENRKKALENLVMLHGQNYFATPVAKGAGREVARTIEKQTARRKVKNRKVKKQ